MENYDNSGEHLVQRTVIVQKDEKGYGLTVSGHNPVFVQSLKEDGAAARVGVQEGDRIIKVNGTLVTQSNHSEVVELIRSGTYVSLTLLGKPYGHNNRLSGGSHPIHLSGSSMAYHGSSSKLSSPSERITGPQPVDAEKQHQLNKEKIHTIKKMLDKEVRYLEDLKSEYSKNPSDKLRQDMSKATKQVKILEEQLLSFTSGTSSDSVPRSPRSPPPVRNSEKETRSASLIVQSPSQQYGKSIVHQTSAPALSKLEQRGVTPQNFTNNTLKLEALISPTGSQASQIKSHFDSTIQKSLPLSTSLENIAKPASPKGSWHAIRLFPTHSRQSSSPDSLLQFHQQKGDHFKSSHGLSRTQSELSHHPFGRKSIVLDHLPESVRKRRRQTHVALRGQSFSNTESSTDSPQVSPPSTPPPIDLTSESMDILESCEIEDACQEEECVCRVLPCDTPENCLTTSAVMQEVKSNLLNRLDGILLPALPLELKPVNTLTSPSQQYGTPPELSPGQCSLHPSQYVIMSMEDEDWPSDSEVGLLENHGPFNAMWKLLRHQAHLAVFMYYLISNSEPASLFFYLITNIYQEGTVKEMKKWAYEIHSSFLVPGAPLKVKNIDKNILNDINDVLQNQLEKEDNLKGIFIKARRKAKEELNELLAEFRMKRTLGLGNFFGPSDSQLEEAMQDKTKELKIIEQLLVPILENLSEDFENADDKTSAMVAALATVLKQFGVKNQQAVNMIERCPSFVAKEKTRLRFLQRNKKPVFVRNHHFLPEHYCCVTFCNHCQLIIWGVGNQGYQCQNCEMNIHKMCVKVVEETCIGTLRNKKDKRRDRMSGIMENIIGKSRKPSQPSPGAIERARKSNEESEADLSGGGAESQVDGGEKVVISLQPDLSRDHAEVLSDDFQVFDTNSTSNTKEQTEDSDFVKKGSSVGRSESFRQQRESRVPLRKRSDPNIPRSKSDAEVDEKNVSDLNNSGSSSNSSLSTRSLDSPSNSLEMVHKTPGGTPADSIPGLVPSTGPLPSSGSSSSSHVHQYDDSDLEAENDPPRWQENVNINVLRLMKPKEKKRQDVINELFHTERTHVRNLKVLDRLFFKPIQQEQLLPPDQLYLLFPNLEEMLEIHSRLNNKMKARRREQPVVGDVGDIMLEMLDGPSGKEIKNAAAKFCRNQSIALESLKNKQKKEQKLAQFLSDTEANHLCRRLQLKDIIAAGFQRLTKYPLLLENIAKYTPQNSEEHRRLLQAVQCSKQILAHVNQAVKESENEHRLGELQKKMDRSAFEKVEAPIVQAYHHLDLTKHKLIHEGPLTWRLHKQKTIEMHVVLLEDILVLLQKQDDKLLLKFHNNNLMSGREDTKVTHSPILRVQNLFTRNVATDSKGFFLVSTSEQHAIYEFVATSASERKMWLKYITEASEAHKPRHGQSAKAQDSSSLLPERTEDISEDSLAKNKVMPVSLDSSHSEVSNGVESTDTGETSDSSSHSVPNTEISSPNPPTTENHPEKDTSSVSPQKEAPSPCSSVEDSQEQQNLERVKLFHVPVKPQLIEPSEIKVSESVVLQIAEPVLTPIEMVRRRDQQITEALAEKQDLISQIFQIPKKEFDHVAEMASELEGQKDLKELVLASIYQANQLTSVLNEGLRVSEDDMISTCSAEVVVEESNSSHSETPSPVVARKTGLILSLPLAKLINISSTLNRHLTQLLSYVSEREEERLRMHDELHASREQLHFLHESHRLCHRLCPSPSNLNDNQSRPNSYISIASSISEGPIDLVDESEETTATITDENFKEPGDEENESEEEHLDCYLGDEDVGEIRQAQDEKYERTEHVFYEKERKQEEDKDKTNQQLSDEMGGKQEHFETEEKTELEFSVIKCTEGELTEKDVEHVESSVRIIKEHKKELSEPSEEELGHHEEKLAEISEKGFLKLNQDERQPGEELSEDCEKQTQYGKECKIEHELEIGSKAVTEEDLSKIKEMEAYNLEGEEDNQEQRLCEEDQEKQSEIEKHLQVLNSEKNNVVKRDNSSIQEDMGEFTEDEEDGDKMQQYQEEQDNETNGFSTPTEQFVDALSGDEEIEGSNPEHPITDIDQEDNILNQENQSKAGDDKCYDKEGNLTQTGLISCTTENRPFDNHVTAKSNANCGLDEVTKDFG
ncbi:uncharacterized protein LOC106468289 isoform X2 [Limulus polyphemus]|nr:uncharacterized protein LOC106468289 isoform X2 [Limulus polyphemus]